MQIEPESGAYGACTFLLENRKIISRNANITPKKIGAFATFWKRKSQGEVIEPFHESDDFDFFVVNCENENSLGQFVFPKSILIQKGIVSTSKKEGKRAFRVYPSWDVPQNKQAQQAQKWQLRYFIRLDDTMQAEKMTTLYRSY